tara:strand:+ start:462 stop:725 length:264 start_codon:yes stop_codon:yes gene_type:complete
MKRNLLKTQYGSKYRKGDFVLIDMVLLQEDKIQGIIIKKLEKPAVAIVEKITYTLTEPVYNLKLIDDSMNHIQFCYHEKDILSAFDI